MLKTMQRLRIHPQVVMIFVDNVGIQVDLAGPTVWEDASSSDDENIEVEGTPINSNVAVVKGKADVHACSCCVRNFISLKAIGTHLKETHNKKVVFECTKCSRKHMD